MNLYKIYKRSFSNISKDIWYFALMMFVNRIGTLILPFLTLYTTQQLGWTKTDAGLATTVFGVGSLVGAYLGGILTDRIGYYKTMILSLLGASVFFWVLQYFTGFYVLCAFLFISSALADIIRPALMSGLTFFADKTTQTRALSLMRMAFNLGFSVGPAIAGVLIEYYGYRSIFVIDSVTCFMAFLFLLTFIKNKSQSGKSEKLETSVSEQKAIVDTPFYIFLLSNFLILLSMFQILFIIPLFLKEELLYSESEVGIFYAINGILIFVFEMPIIYYIEKKWSYFKSMIIGAVMMSLAIGMFLFSVHHLIIVGLYMFLVTFGEIVNFPFIYTVALNRAPEDKKGKYTSYTAMTFSLALIFSPLIGTGIVDQYGYNAGFTAMTAIGLLGALGLYLLAPLFKGEELDAQHSH